MGRLREEAQREDATAGEKAELERIREVYTAGKEALNAGEHAAAAGLFGQCASGLGEWRKEVEGRKERERAAAAAQQAEEQRKLAERKARERAEEAARKEAERKRAEEEEARRREDAILVGKLVGRLVLVGLLAWGAALVTSWWSERTREAALREKEAAREAAILKTRDEVSRRMGKGGQAGEQKTIPVGKDAKMTFVWCPPGNFMMGSNNGESDEDPPHEVTLTKGFWMAKTEVTQKQWKSVMGSGNNPSEHRGDDLPVEHVSWNDCVEFCRQTGLELPTEAEWEYACRAGTTGDYAGTGNLRTMGWYAGNSGKETQAAGRQQPNKWGLLDMHGNVWEWCAEWYGKYPIGAVTNPTGAASGWDHVLRGGSCRDGPKSCRSANRGSEDSNRPQYQEPGRHWGYGFRPVVRQN